MNVVVLTRVPGVVLERLRERTAVTDVSELPRAEWGPALAGATGVLSSSNVPIDAAFLAQAPALRIVAMQSVGYDNVDVPRLRERGIVLTNSRGSLVEAVADLAYGLVIIAVRQLGAAIAWGRDGRWLAHGDPPYSHDLEGATLGVVGFGAIGVALAQRAQASKMRVVYHTRTPRPDDAQTGGSYRSFEALLAEADCVVALLPLTAQTRGMFGDDAFARMKPSARFVNAARGPICDTNALLRALEQKKIAGAVLDVTDPEPLPPEHPLFAREDVVITPHVGSATIETRTRMAMLAAQNLLAFADQKPLLTPVA
ncbi:MAG: glyoxylate reductase [Candidatus Eremiobacteraeota bacterium]|jgi:glyoxylate reductase|nr:glyoxylate reductase [Candidatus Eremiobacteraeota bacterium]